MSPTDKYDRVRGALMKWRKGLKVRGMPLPPVADLELIASNPTRWPGDEVGATTSAYRGNIGYLVGQALFGVNDPVAHAIEAELYDPSPGFPPDQLLASPEDEPRPDESPWVEVLEAWRDEQLARTPDDSSLARLTGQRLKNIADLPPNLSRMLAGFGLSQYEKEIRRILGGSDSASPGSHTREPEVDGVLPDGSDATSGDRAMDGAGNAVAPENQTTDLVDADDFEMAALVRKSPEQSVVATVAQTAAGVRIAWQDASSGEAVRIYRIGMGATIKQSNPDRSRQRLATTASEIVDTTPVTAVRLYQIWCYEGATATQARRSQPREVTKVYYVPPVQDVRILPSVVLRPVSRGRPVPNGRPSPITRASAVEDVPSAEVGWRTAPGVVAVEVYRHPGDRDIVEPRSSMYRQCESTPCLNGFRDTDARLRPGTSWEYVAYARAADGTYSVGVTIPYVVPIELQPVQDLTVAVGAHGNVLEVRWTEPPDATVELYIGDKRPLGRVAGQTLLAAALQTADTGLDTAVKQWGDYQREGSKSWRILPWPNELLDEHRIFVTPVTVPESGQAVCVGVTAVVVFVGPVTEPELRERIHHQTLTFAWPVGADEVMAFIAGQHEHADPDQELSFRERVGTRMPNYVIDRQEWLAQGAMHLTRPPLDASGARLHLYAVAREGGDLEAVGPTPVDYPGRRVLRYELSWDWDTADTIDVTLSVHLPPQSTPPLSLTLIHDPRRFPLSAEMDTSPNTLGSERAYAVPLAPDHGADAHSTKVITTPLGLGGAPLVWRGKVSVPPGPHGGYLRLFATNYPDDLGVVAVIDPSLDQLMLVLGTPEDEP